MLLSFFIGLLTAVLVLDCLFLLLLILIQLPKKEAGLGQAFGSSTTDALFGAGSGTALTKMTKYAAVVFFVLTFFLCLLNSHESKAKRGGRLRQAIEEASKKAPAPTPAPAPGATSAPIEIKLPEAPLKLTNLPAAASNVPAPTTQPPSTNVPSAPAAK